MKEFENTCMRTTSGNSKNFAKKSPRPSLIIKMIDEHKHEIERTITRVLKMPNFGLLGVESTSVVSLIFDPLRLTEMILPNTSKA